MEEKKLMLNIFQFWTLCIGVTGTVTQMLELFQECLAQLVEIDRSLAIFVMATYGEGDPTDNAQEFYDWLQEGTTQLDGLRYAVSCLLQWLSFYVFWKK